MSRSGCRSKRSFSTTCWKSKRPGKRISCATAVSSKVPWRARKTPSYGEEDIVTLAVRLIAGIAQAHAFEQGNKRTAVEPMWHFLQINGYDLAIEDGAAWERPVVELIEHVISEEDFVTLLRPFVVER
jgi:prophage maintenance system killer protein